MKASGLDPGAITVKAAFSSFDYCEAMGHIRGRLNNDGLLQFVSAGEVSLGTPEVGRGLNEVCFVLGLL